MKPAGSTDGPKPSLTASLTRHPSAWFLLVANVLPLFGIFTHGWDSADLVLLYWLENVIIGVCTIAKMITRGIVFLSELPGALFLSAFFTVHYGMFCAVHGVFVGVLFTQSQPQMPNPLNLIQQALVESWWVVLALAISHGASFVMNFVLGREYVKVTAKDLFGAPYGRIVVLHISIIGSGFVTMSMGSPVPALVLFALLKTLLDVVLHLKERERGVIRLMRPTGKVVES